MNIKKWAVVCSVLTLVSLLGCGITGFFLLNGYGINTPSKILEWLFRFFFTFGGSVGVLAIITVTRIKTKIS